jgi:hypothetical protein
MIFDSKDWKPPTVPFTEANKIKMLEEMVQDEVLVSVVGKSFVEAVRKYVEGNKK